MRRGNAIFGTMLIVAGAAAAVFIFAENRLSLSREAYKAALPSVPMHQVPEGKTFGQIAEEEGLSGSQTAALIEAAKSAYDLATVVAGREYAFHRDETGAVMGLEYEISADEKLFVTRSEAGEAWTAERRAIPYDLIYETSEGTVETSLWETITAAGGDPLLAIALSEIFAWQVDFAIDIQKGDTFRAYYAKRYLDGEYVMPGDILAAEFANNGTTYRAFYFRGAATPAGYYDEQGNALQKVFLKTPLQYKYISSGYTTKIRVVSSLGLVGRHRGIDFAANYGTPAVSIGDGTVTRAGWDKYLGWSVEVRHNETYSSVYGHFQSIAKGIKRGAHVTQGQVVGYVGSTGYSTGPHLHFEVKKFGSQINPLAMDVPPGKPIDPADKELFETSIARIQALAGF